MSKFREQSMRFLAYISFSFFAVGSTFAAETPLAIDDGFKFSLDLVGIHLHWDMQLGY